MHLAAPASLPAHVPDSLPVPASHRVPAEPLAAHPKAEPRPLVFVLPVPASAAADSVTRR